MIEAIGLEKYYGKKLAVHDVSFFVGKGEAVGLLGPNGAGKSTIMRMLTGFLPATNGTASIAGFDIGKTPIEAKKRIGYLPELPPLYVEMTVREFLHFAAGIKLVPGGERKVAVERAIERCALVEMAERRIEHLSKGYRQRVGIAQAIVHDPEVVILDEPTAGLDPQQVIEVRNLVRELTERMTVLISSHILSEIDAICGRVIIINRGQLIAQDSTEGVKARMSVVGRRLIRLDVAGDVDRVLGKMREHAFVDSVEELGRSEDEGARVCRCRIVCDGVGEYRNDIARTVLDSGACLLALRQEETSLEEAFLQLTKEAEP